MVDYNHLMHIPKIITGLNV